MDNTKRYASGYSEAGASMFRRAMKAFVPNSGSPNDDIIRNLSTLRQRSRMLYMASPVATSAIETNKTKVIGSGLVVQPSINAERLGITPEAAKEWERNTFEEFELWANRKESCDSIGMNTFYDLQVIALASALLSGDSFAVVQRSAATQLEPYTLRIHLVEADRVATPSKYGCTTINGLTDGKVPENEKGAGNRIFDGVEVDSAGKVVAYHIRNTYPNEIAAEEAKSVRVEVRGKKTGLPNILHIISCERPDQYRGVPYLAKVIEPILQLRRYTESELMAALVQSFFSAWITTETDQSQIPINEVGSGIDGDTSAQEHDNSDNASEYDMGPGTVAHLAPGESITFGNPNIPTAGFENFVKTLCKMIGASLEIPYDVLIKEFNSSYSASRAALMEAWEAFKMRRAWFVRDFCQPIYELWLTEAVAIGRIKAPGFLTNPRIRAEYCKANWVGPVQGQLDPLKEVKASVIQVENGFKTNAQVTREQGGGDWDRNIETLKHENEMKSDAGVVSSAQINNAGGEVNGDPD